LAVKAQHNCSLKIIPADSTQPNIQQLALTTSFNNKTTCLQYVQQLNTLLAAKGYIAASVDSTWEMADTVFIKLYTGNKYVWTDVAVNDRDWPLLNQLGYSRTTFNNKPFEHAKVEALYKKALDYFEDNGYPFAKIYLDSISMNDGRISASLVIDKGNLYYIDSIRVHGNAKLSEDFLYRYLDLQQHNIYQRSKLTKINQRLNELAFVEQHQPWQLTMLNTGGVLDLYLQPKRSNQVDVLVGFLPANDANDGKLLLTGEANLNLKNPFGHGESILVNWQQLQARSPRLNLAFQRPYIFNSPLGFNFNFQLYKLDSFYLNLNAQVGLQYIFSARQSGAVYLQTFGTTLLSVDTATVRATKQLPDVADMNTTSLAVQYNFNNTNYKFNPRKGNELEFILSFGKKNIKKNSNIEQLKDTAFDYASLYDTVQQHTYQLRASIAGTHYFPVGKQSTFKTTLSGGWYQSSNYYRNELFQIGGYKLLRGFNEETIYANRYAVGSFEYRYLFGVNSYFFGFTDAGWATFQSNTSNDAHTYIGVGVGMAFETKTGIFNISLAVGKQDGDAFSFNQPKIHIGYVSLF
jgi:outer membrane protein assembly factor BamA